MSLSDVRRIWFVHSLKQSAFVVPVNITDLFSYGLWYEAHSSSCAVAKEFSSVYLPSLTSLAQMTLCTLDGTVTQEPIRSHIVSAFSRDSLLQI